MITSSNNFHFGTSVSPIDRKHVTFYKRNTYQIHFPIHIYAALHTCHNMSHSPSFITYFSIYCVFKTDVLRRGREKGKKIEAKMEKLQKSMSDTNSRFDFFLFIYDTYFIKI